MGRLPAVGGGGEGEGARGRQHLAVNSIFSNELFFAEKKLSKEDQKIDWVDCT